MSKARRDEILNAAYDLAAEGGLEALHARSVAARVGINHAAVHYYFKRRSDLLAALADFFVQRLTEDRASRIGSTTSAKDRLRAHLAHASELCRTESGFAAVWVALSDAARTDEGVRTELVRHLREWAATLQIELDAIGELPSDHPLAYGETLAACLLGIILSSSLLNGDGKAPERIAAIERDLLS